MTVEVEKAIRETEGLWMESINRSISSIAGSLSVIRETMEVLHERIKKLEAK